MRHTIKCCGLLGKKDVEMEHTEVLPIGIYYKTAADQGDVECAHGKIERDTFTGLVTWLRGAG